VLGLVLPPSTRRTGGVVLWGGGKGLERSLGRDSGTERRGSKHIYMNEYHNISNSSHFH
jgi:hypothetical protein